MDKCHTIVVFQLVDFQYGSSIGSRSSRHLPYSTSHAPIYKLFIIVKANPVLPKCGPRVPLDICASSWSFHIVVENLRNRWFYRNKPHCRISFRLNCINILMSQGILIEIREGFLTLLLVEYFLSLLFAYTVIFVNNAYKHPGPPSFSKPSS